MFPRRWWPTVHRRSRHGRQGSRPCVLPHRNRSPAIGGHPRSGPDPPRECPRTGQPARVVVGRRHRSRTRSVRGSVPPQTPRVRRAPGPQPGLLAATGRGGGSGPAVRSRRLAGLHGQEASSMTPFGLMPRVDTAVAASYSPSSDSMFGRSPRAPPASSRDGTTQEPPSTASVSPREVTIGT